MNKKVGFLGLGCLLSGVAIAISCIAIINHNRPMQKAKGTDPYTLTIESGAFTEHTAYTDGNVQFVTDSTKTLPEAQQNKVKLNFHAVAKNGEGRTVLQQDAGWIGNDKASAIRSMTRIDLEGFSNVIISWGWYDADLDDIKFEKSDVINASGSEFSFDYDKPNYFRITAPDYASPQLGKIIIYYGRECEESSDPYYDEGGLRYYLYKDYAEVLGFSESSLATVNIPAYVKGKPVESIREQAFDYESAITSLTLPNTLKIIGICAFQGCSQIGAIHIPKSVTRIDRCAFDCTTNCTNLTFEAGGTELLIIGQAAFSENGHTGTLTLPSRIKSFSIGGTPFATLSHCSAFALNEDNVEGNVAYVEDGVLFSSQNNQHLLVAYPCQKTDTTYTVPANIDELISYDSFAHNDYIEEVTFQNTGALSLPEYCMVSNHNLRTINFGTGPVTLYWCPIRYNEKLELVLPANAIVLSAGLGQIGGSVTTPKNIYFLGTPEDKAANWSDDWDGGDEADGKIKVLYYSASEPATTEAKLTSWHYVDGVPTAWLKQVKIISNSTYNADNAIFGIWAQSGEEWHLYVGQPDGDNWLFNVPGETQTYVIIRMDPAGSPFADAWPTGYVWGQTANQYTFFLQFTITAYESGTLYGDWA